MPILEALIFRLHFQQDMLRECLRHWQRIDKII